MRRYLCFYFPRWPIQCLRRNLPETVGQPLAVFERMAHGPVVAVCSREAGRLGVRGGMSVTDARALVPEVLLHEADFAEYQAQLEALCLWSVQFSPLIGIESEGPHAPRPEALFLDTTGCETVFRGEDNLLRQAAEALRKQGLEARIALAPTLGAAWAVAHAAPHLAPSQGVRGNNSGTIIANDPDALRAALEPLPLPALRLDGETLAFLYSLGLKTVGELLRQPRSTLPSRFGPALIERMDQALGVAPERMTPFFPPPEFRAAGSFEYPVRSTEILFPIVDRMIENLAGELHRAHRGARQIECWLFHEVATPLRIELTLHRGSADAAHLAKLLRVKMEGALRTATLLKSRHARGQRKSRTRSSFSVETHDRVLDVEEGVCAAALHVISSEASRSRQLSLFERSADESLSGGMAQLLDSLASRLGPAAVLRARLEDAHLPEQAYRVLTLDDSRDIRHADQIRNEDQTETPERPILLLHEPARVTMISPTEFAWNGRCAPIHRTTGPERIETAWWQARDERRDYYIVESPSGARYWLFQKTGGGEWFLHGLFE